jgi:hypothetical protein
MGHLGDPAYTAVEFDPEIRDHAALVEANHRGAPQVDVGEGGQLGPDLQQPKQTHVLYI